LNEWVQLATAALTLANTLILVWNHRRMRRVSQKVNGMYLQTLADAELRGRLQGAAAAEVAPAAIAAKISQPRTDPQA
jgi:hypothetical protein